MPEPKRYVYRGNGSDQRLFRAPRCPECGGKPRLQRGSAHLGICLGCRVLLVLHEGRWHS